MMNPPHQRQRAPTTSGAQIAASFPRPTVGLNLVTAAASAATGALELAALGRVAGVGLGGAVGHTRSAAEVLVHLTGLESAAQEHAVGSGGGAERELIKGDDLATSSNDASAGSVSSAEGADGELQLAAVEEAHIVGDGSHNNGGLARLAIHLLGKLSNRNGRPVGAAHEKALENDRIEFTLCAASQESI